MVALRSRILARFTELEAERAQTGKQLAALAKDTTPPSEPALLDHLPLLAGLLKDAPESFQTRLYQAFDLQLVYNKEDNQVSFHAVITPATLTALAQLIHDSETPNPPAPSVLTPHT